MPLQLARTQLLAASFLGLFTCATLADVRSQQRVPATRPVVEVDRRFEFRFRAASLAQVMNCYAKGTGNAVEYPGNNHTVISIGGPPLVTPEEALHTIQLLAKSLGLSAELREGLLVVRRKE
jgi:hypothetical protein